MKNCRVCSVELTDSNWALSLKNKNSVICKICHHNKCKDWRKNNRDKSNAHSRLNYQKNKVQYFNRINNHRRKLRLETIVVYGGKCNGCGVDDTDLLDIDHIFNDGASDRKKKFIRIQPI